MRRPEFVARQSACPSGLLGRLIGRVMAQETAAANDVALELLDLRATDHVLEVGFGHGRTLERASAAVSGGFVAGIDPSAEMCRMARRRNRCEIARGRIEIHQASAEDIPYPPARFDRALTVHTAYFWTGLSEPLTEIARVLKPNGRLVLVHRTDAHASADFPANVYRFRSAEDMTEALRRAGFEGVTVVNRTLSAARLAFHVADR